jgi:hypothetical protein
MDEVHAIMNLDKYAAYIRRRAAISFSEDYVEDLNEFVTIKQTVDMIVEHSIGKDEKGLYLIDEKSHKRLFEEIRLRIYNSGLSKLAAKDVLECAWDEKKDEMVFWAKKKDA